MRPRVLSGANLVLPGRVLAPGTIVIEGDRIVEVASGARPVSDGVEHVDLRDQHVVPGFVDVHVHGIDGHDVMDGGDGLVSVATMLPRYGVTAFCPTSVACAPRDLRALLADVRRLRTHPPPSAARILPAHLESNFIAPQYAGAQPIACLRRPPAADPARPESSRAESPDSFTGVEVLDEISRARTEVAIVTLAPELPGGLDLVRALTAQGHRVSVGHSAADFEEGLAAVSAGACHATHLFNRMPPLAHRAPGLVGAVLQSESMVAEVVCDGFHVHPALVRLTVACKQPAGTMAITDGTAASGLAPGSRTRLGGRPIVAREMAAYLDDGTLAGSVCTMDRAFRTLVVRVGLSWVDAVTLCATTPAVALGLDGYGAIRVGAVADLTVLDPHLTVVRTYVEIGRAHV